MKPVTRFVGELGVLSAPTACFAWGQSANSSEVSAMVTDPCSAVVPQLTLTITDIDKNTERTFTTNDSGVYDSRTLLPANRCLLIFRKESFITDYGHQLGYLQSEPEY